MQNNKCIHEITITNSISVADWEWKIYVNNDKKEKLFSTLCNHEITVLTNEIWFMITNGSYNFFIENSERRENC